MKITVEKLGIAVRAARRSIFPSTVCERERQLRKRSLIFRCRVAWAAVKHTFTRTEYSSRW